MAAPSSQFEEMADIPLAELLSALSHALDLTEGQPPGSDDPYHQLAKGP